MTYDAKSIFQTFQAAGHELSVERAEAVADLVYEKGQEEAFRWAYRNQGREVAQDLREFPQAFSDAHLDPDVLIASLGHTADLIRRRTFTYTPDLDREQLAEIEARIARVEARRVAAAQRKAA